MRVSEEKIEEIRSATDIVEVVSAYVRLKKRGKNYVGLCPFHQEKTASFSVSPEKQMYYCFGCGEGGNVFTFVMRTEKVSFNEALQTLAARAGITVPVLSGTTDEGEGNEPLYRANMLAARFYHNNLMQTPEGAFALDYFRKRGFSDETIKHFGLGYAPRNWEALVNYAKEQDIPLDVLEKAGLAARRDDGTYFDKFRGRAIFPILATTGRVVAFAGRQLYDDDSMAKYVNTPETELYRKSRILYGLSMTRDAIRKQEYAVLVEGYTDLISLYQAGVTNVVASSGTALTDEQIALLGRYAPSIVIVYDADSAGSSAALRGVEKILEKGLDVRVARLPESEDPDSFVKRHGRDAFLDIIDQGISFLDYKASLLKEDGSFETPEGQARAVRSIIEILAKMPDELKRNFYIKSLAERYGLYESTLYRELEVFTRKNRARRSPDPIPVGENPDPSPKTESEGKIPPDDEIPVAERDLLKLMLRGNREVLVFSMSRIQADDLSSERSRALYTALCDHYKQTGSIDPSALIALPEFQDFTNLITSLNSERYEISTKWESIRGYSEQPADLPHAQDAIRIIKKNHVKIRIDAVRRQIREVENGGGDGLTLARNLQLLQEELKQIDQLYRMPVHDA